MLASIAPADLLALKYPISAEIKYDGVRTIAVVNLGKCRLYSRNGKLLENFDEVKQQIEQMEDAVYDGEVISLDGFQKLMTRTHAEPGKNVDVKIEYKIFDKLTIDEWVQGISRRPYSTRCKDLGEKVIIKNPVDLEVYYNYVLKSGYEGLILKQLDSPYESGTNKYWLKLKPKDTLDMTILSVDEGMGKNTGRLGAIQAHCEHHNETIYAYVGTGFTDAQRESLFKDRANLVGKVIEVEYQEVTKADRNRSRSLRFPVFKCLRIDK